ncbi:serine hydrolase domain-containing protein [Kineococcus sp. LSe6-4]|uniref:Serine hydrolase domain-containing protein n=1 Tax=Kineococcus halophytocola TaxID=3234027 RepID=A0ABV4GY77_9ACTN
MLAFASWLATGTPARAGASSTAQAATAPAATAPAAAHELTTGDVDTWLEGLLPTVLAREGIAGAVVSVVHDGQTVTRRGFGLAGTGAGPDDSGAERVDPERTLFRIGSISKLVTATAVLQLVQDGVLYLDAPVQDHLDFTLPTRFPQPVTLRHLLSHTAGFEDRIAGVILAPRADPPTLRAVVTTDPPEQIFAPGTVPAYSNYSNALAAYVVQRVTGRDYADWATDHVLTAAGMSTATFAQPLPAHLADRMSKGYDSTGSAPVPFEIVGPAPAGAISATAADMSAFMLSQLGHETGATTATGPAPGPAPGPPLRSSTRDLMHRPALGPDQLGGLAAGPRMALGYFDQSRNGHRILGHAGDLTAFHAQLQIYPEDDTGIFLALNSTGVRPDSSLAVREQLLTGFSDRYFPDRRPAPAALSTSAEHSARAEGAYLISRRSQSTFARLFFLLSAVDVRAGAEGTVTISQITDPSGALVPFVEVEPWVWQEVDGQRRVAAAHDGTAVTAIGLDPAFTLHPMPTRQAVLPWVLAVSLGIVVAWLLICLVTSVHGWRHRIRRHRTRGDRLVRAAGTTSVVALAAAGTLWAVVATALLNDAPPPASWLIRLAQVLTALAVLGVVPAAWSTARSARQAGRTGDRRGWLEVTLRAVLTVGFAGLGYGVLVGGLLATSITC